jgi:cell division protein FtsB
MKEIKVFIAGSKSLTVERDAIRSVLQILSNSNSKKVLIRTYTYEEFDQSLSHEGRQKEYNRFIKSEADYVIFVLDGTVGGITLTEFDVAWKTFTSEKRPGIYVYHKPTNTTSKGIQDVIGRINQCEQYYTEYSDIENLKLKVESAFRRVIDIRVTHPLTMLWVTLVATILVLIGVGMFVLKNKLADRPAVTTTTMETQRQDSIEKALQAEADRLEQERKRLEKQAQQIEEKNKQTVTKQTSKPATTSAKSATSSKPTFSTPTKVSTNTTTVEAAPKASSFVQTKENADNGDAASCYKVAMAYMNGSDVQKDLAAAFRYMKSAADRGYTAAYIEVAKMYHGGRGVAKNRSTAEFWYKKAADAGNAEARRILLNM